MDQPRVRRDWCCPSKACVSVGYVLGRDTGLDDYFRGTLSRHGGAIQIEGAKHHVVEGFPPVAARLEAVSEPSRGAASTAYLSRCSTPLA